MPGSARSIVVTTFTGLRVASTYYYPAHSKNGKNISQRLVINAFANVAKRGGEADSDVYTLTAWGKLADICAKSMSPGKEFNALAESKAYMGRVFQNNQPLQLSDGSLIQTRKYSWTILRLTFGEESHKLINSEIQKGIRPADWNTPGAPGYQTWRTILQQRMAIQFDPNKGTFGYARVRVPQGPGIGAYIPNQPSNGGVPNSQQVASDVYNATVNVGATPQTTPAAAPSSAPVQAPASAPAASGDLFGV